MSSLSNPDTAVVTDLEWTADVLFEQCCLDCKAVYAVEIQDHTNDEDGKEEERKDVTLQLDTKDLLITRISINDQPDTKEWTLEDEIADKPHLGQRLTIRFTEDEMAQSSSAFSSVVSLRVCVWYSTTVRSSAVQWLPPAQTAGKVHPYLFTQCQAIHARSLLPCQDCPGVKYTYRATVTTPAWATAVMSALSTSSTINSTNDTQTFLFEQSVPISSYLFALAVGELSSRTISPRCRIWSEPNVLAAAASEFSATTEKFLSAAEEITGLDYAWTRYDLLVLPPSFPYGGMENPCLTFVTPTLLAGDESLVDVVAHEIAHSWTGNLITNQTWEHFWLNEGWTMYLQRKITAQVKQDERYFFLDAQAGYKGLQDDLTRMPPEFASLIPKLGDSDPDDCFSRVPYEKGFCLIYAIELRVGKTAMAKFTKAYIQQFKFLTVTSQQFRQFVNEHFSTDQQSQQAMDTFDWDTWLHTPGMPPEKMDFDDSLAQEAKQHAQEWLRYDNNDATTAVSPPSPRSFSSSAVTCCFLDALLESTASSGNLARHTVRGLQSTYSYDTSHNAEILSRYCRLAIPTGESLDVAVRLITTQGRMKFVRPIYRTLYQHSRQLAVDTFVEHYTIYHPIATKMLATDLELELAKDENGRVVVKEKKKEKGIVVADENENENEKIVVVDEGSYYRRLLYVTLGVSLIGLVLLRRRKK